MAAALLRKQQQERRCPVGDIAAATAWQSGQGSAANPTGIGLLVLELSVAQQSVKRLPEHEPQDQDAGHKRKQENQEA